MTIQLKRAKRAYFEVTNQVYASGEPLFEKDTGKMKIGNGVDKYNDLPYVDAKELITDTQIESLFE